MESKEPPDIASVAVRDDNGNIEETANTENVADDSQIIKNSNPTQADANIATEMEHLETETKENRIENNESIDNEIVSSENENNCASDEKSQNENIEELVVETVDPDDYQIINKESTQADANVVTEKEYLETTTKESKIKNFESIDNEIVSSERIENEINSGSNANEIGSKEKAKSDNLDIESITQSGEENSIVKSLNTDLECVIAEATKLQSQVLESILGGNELKTVEAHNEAIQICNINEKTTEEQQETFIEEHIVSCNVEKEESASIQSDSILNLTEKTETVVETCIDKNSSQNNVYEMTISQECDNVMEVKKDAELNKSENYSIKVEGITTTCPEESKIDRNELNELEIKTVDETEENDIIDKGEECIDENSEKIQDIEENIHDKKIDIEATNTYFCKEVTENTESSPDVVETICETKKEIILQSEDTESISQRPEDKREETEESSMQENAVNVDNIAFDVSLEKIEIEKALENTEPSLSPTPDLVKVCDIKAAAVEEQYQESQQVKNELQQVNEAITDAHRECQIQELNKSLIEAKVLSNSNSDALIKPINRTTSKDMIVDLIPEPVKNICENSGNENKNVISDIPTKKLSSAASIQQKLKRGQSEPLEEKQTTNGITKKKSLQSDERRNSKTGTRKDRPKSTIIAGQKIDLHSDKAQYLHLTLEQMQQLAIQQKSGELFASENRSESEHDDNSHCALHSSKTEKTNRGIRTAKKKTSTNTHRDPSLRKQLDENTASETKDILQSPDVIKEAEASSAEKKLENTGDYLTDTAGDKDLQKRLNSPVRKSPAPEDKRSGRSASIVRQNTQGKNTVTKSGKSVEDKNITKRSNSKVREKTIQKKDMLYASKNKTENLSQANGTHVVEKSKGGLLAPTQSWLSRIGDKMDIKTRSPSPGPKEQKRSISVPRKLYERSPSPKRRIKDESGKPSAVSVRRTSSIRRNMPKNGDGDKLSLVTNSVPPSLTKTGNETTLKESAKNVTINGSETTEMAQTLHELNGDTKVSAKIKLNSKPKKIVQLAKQEIKTSKNSSQKILSVSTSICAANSLNQTDDTAMEVVTAKVSTTALNQSDAMSETSKISSSIMSGVEETSISVTEVIKEAEASTTEKKLENTGDILADTKSKRKSSPVRKSPALEDRRPGRSASVVRQSKNKVTKSDSVSENSVDDKKAPKRSNSKVHDKAIKVSTNVSAANTENQTENQTEDVTKTIEVSTTALLQSDDMSEVSKISSSVISGVEETSISATEVIEMFESESKAFTMSETNASSCFQQESVTNAANVVEEKQTGEKTMKESDIVEKVKKSKSLTKSVNSKSTNGSSTQTGKSNGYLGTVGDKSIKNGTQVGNTEETSKKTADILTKTKGDEQILRKSEMKNSTTKTGSRSSSSSRSASSKNTTDTLITVKADEQLRGKVMKSDLKTSATITASKSSSRSDGTNPSVSSKKSATFVKESLENQTNGTTSTNSSTKTRTTMIVRLHPGQSKRLSAYLEQQPGDPSSNSSPSSLLWAGDVQYEDTPGSICGLEISFSSVPQDIDIKLIPAGEHCDVKSEGEDKLGVQGYQQGQECKPCTT